MSVGAAAARAASTSTSGRLERLKALLRAQFPRTAARSPSRARRAACRTRPISSRAATGARCCASSRTLCCPSAHAIDREYRVLTALRGSAVPMPEPYRYCAERDILGTPFYLMEWLRRPRLRRVLDCPGLTPAERRAFPCRCAEALAAIHQLRLRARWGLRDFGRPGNYFARQLSALVGALWRQFRSAVRRCRHRPARSHGSGRAHSRQRDARALPWRLPHRQPDVPCQRAARDRRARLGALDARPSPGRRRLQQPGLADGARRKRRPSRPASGRARHSRRGRLSRALLRAGRIDGSA